MTPDRWQTIKELFNAALQRPVEERPGFLDAACGRDEFIRSEVESLLAAHVKDQDFLAVPAFERGAELILDSGRGVVAGEQIGPYKILEELGRGGMGEVYLARDTRLGRNVALKVLPFEFARDRQRVDRFEQEARTASALNHPNVCVIHEIGATDDGRQFIAMEYIEGLTLRARMAQQRMTLAEALDIGAQVAWALEAAHAAGVVHRDIKPENIMLRRDGYVKVLDFGIAKLNENLSQSFAISEASTLARVHTEPGTRMGTVKYMSPEQLRERPVDERTDIWSLGVVLHEMVTGTTPFEARTTNEMIAAILERQPLIIPAHAQAVPDEFWQIVKKALSKKRRERYQKASNLAADLRRLRRQIEVDGAGRFAGPQTASAQKLKDISLPAFDNSAGVARPEKHRTRFLTTAESIVTEIKAHKKAATFAAVGAVLAFLFVGPYLPRLATGLRNSLSRNQQRMSSTKGDPTLITNSGTTVCAAISPNGEVVAHAEKKNGMQEVRLTSIATGATSTLIQPEAVTYLGITFSPDNHYLNLTRTENQASSGILYQVALPGNSLRKMMVGVDSPITFSPDGGQFSFVRVSESTGEYWLMIAGVEGTDARAIGTRSGGNTLSRYGLAWSSDGQAIICGAGWWDNDYFMNVVEFSIADQRERPVSNKQWYSVLQAAWLPGKSGIIISAKEQALSPYQLWELPYPQGEPRRMTTGTTEHKSVSVSRDGKSIVSVQSHQNGKIWVGALDEQHARVLVTTEGRGYGLSWIDKERIVFSSMVGNNLNISRINTDGSNHTRLTANSGDNYTPAVSPDGRLIIFVSNRTGGLNIWRMNSDDGSDVRQLTFSGGNAHPTCSADGKWVLYDNQSNRAFTLWKVPIDGGTPVRLTDKYAWMPVVSPDNQFIACRYQIEADKLGIAILPFQGGAPLSKLRIPVRDWQQVTWNADSRGLTYIEADARASNIWSDDRNGSPPRKLTSFNSDQIYAYAWSPDHTQLATTCGAEVRDVILINNE